jgi:hypothetical protein
MNTVLTITTDLWIGPIHHEENHAFRGAPIYAPGGPYRVVGVIVPEPYQSGISDHLQPQLPHFDNRRVR